MNLRNVLTVTKYVAVTSLTVSVTSFVYLYFVVPPVTVVQNLNPNRTVDMRLERDHIYEIAFATDRQKHLIKVVKTVQRGNNPFNGNVIVSSREHGQIELTRSYQMNPNRRMSSSLQPSWIGRMLGTSYMFMLYRFSVPASDTYQVKLEDLAQEKARKGGFKVVERPSWRTMKRMSYADLYLLRVPFYLFLFTLTVFSLNVLVNQE